MNNKLLIIGFLFIVSCSTCIYANGGNTVELDPNFNCSFSSVILAIGAKIATALCYAIGIAGACFAILYVRRFLLTEVIESADFKKQRLLAAENRVRVARLDSGRFDEWNQSQPVRWSDSEVFPGSFAWKEYSDYVRRGRK